MCISIRVHKIACMNTFCMCIITYVHACLHIKTNMIKINTVGGGGGLPLAYMHSYMMGPFQRKRTILICGFYTVD